MPIPALTDPDLRHRLLWSVSGENSRRKASFDGCQVVLIVFNDNWSYPVMITRNAHSENWLGRCRLASAQGGQSNDSNRRPSEDNDERETDKVKPRDSLRPEPTQEAAGPWPGMRRGDSSQRDETIASSSDTDWPKRCLARWARNSTMSTIGT